MERRESSKRENHNTSHTHHRKHERSSGPREKKKIKHVSQCLRHGESKQYQDESHELPELGGDVDYIRSWIAQTDSRKDAGGVNLQAIQTQFGQSDVRRQPQRHSTYLRHSDLILEDAPATRKRRRNSSSDSSFLEPAEPETRIGSLFRDTVCKPPAKEERLVSQIHKKRKAESVLSKASGQPKYRQETFERRPRHKTCEDLYDLSKRKERNVQEKGKRVRKKREKRGDRMRAAKRVGDDLMNNFSSESICQERLTMRPSHGPGIFKNGRASSPAKRRGLPDLAFSEMEFLRHCTRSKRSVPTVDKGRKNANERDKRKTGMAYEEMSTFFMPARTPLEETNSISRAGRPSSNHSNERSRNSQNTELNDTDGSQRPSYGLDIPQNEYLGVDQAKPIPKIPSMHSRNSPFVSSHGNANDAKSFCSGNTTYYTWSETQMTPIAVQKKQHSRLPSSPAPESVRRSIELSGILNYTGIRLTPELRGIRKMVYPTTDYTQSGYNPAKTCSAPKIYSFASTSAESSGDQSWISFSSRDEILNSHSRDQSPSGLQLLERQAGNEAIACLTGQTSYGGDCTKVPLRATKEINIEHYDSVLGWHQRRDPRTHEISRSSEASKEPKTMPITREEIARNARIKRPSTTLPVKRAEEGSHPRLIENQQPLIPAEEAIRPNYIPSVSSKGASPMVSIQSTRPTYSITSAQHDTRRSEFADKTLQEEQHPLSVDTKTHTGRSEIDPKGSSTPEANVDSIMASALLYRGGFYGYHRGIAPRSTARLSPVPECPPLYLSQVQREYASQVGPTNYDECIIDRHRNQYFEGPPLMNEGLLALEDVELGYSADNAETLQCSSTKYAYPNMNHLTLELEPEFHFHTSVDHSDPELGERTGQNSRGETRDFETGYGVDYITSSSNEYHFREFGTYGFDDQYALDQEMNEYSSLIDGFWRPQTYY